MNGIRIVYASADRVCLKRDDVVVSAERATGVLEARRSGSGGPMSGEVMARSTRGVWTAPPSDEDYWSIDEMFSAASRMLQEAGSPRDEHPEEL